MGTTLENVLEDIKALKEHIEYYANCKQINIDKQNLEKAIGELENIARFIRGLK